MFLINLTPEINARNVERMKLAEGSFPRDVTYCRRYSITSFVALNVTFHQQNPLDTPSTSAPKQCRLVRKTEFLYYNKVPGAVTLLGLLSDESMCGEPEEPVAGHVVVGSDGMAIYSCDSGYRLLAEPNRTCDRDGHWMGHAPQCEGLHRTNCNINPTEVVQFLLNSDHATTRYSLQT
jgi:hypothetical protein